MTQSRTDARPFVSALIVTGLVVATAAGATLAGTSASAAPHTINPFADAGGFSVYAIGDANLDNSEIEGALAVGGTLRGATPGNRLPIVHYVAGTPDFDVPIIDGDPTRLLVAGFSTGSGIVDVSGAGVPTGVSKGYAKLVNPDLTTFQFAERGGYVQYRARLIAGSESNGPVIEGKNHVWASDGVAKFVANGTSVAEYVEVGEGFDLVNQCLANPSSAGSNNVVVTEDGGKAKLALVENSVNIVDYDDLFFWGNYASEITYSGTVRPSVTSPVVVRVPAGVTSVKGSTFGASGQYANFVMWDLSALSGDVTLTDKQGASTRIDGSVYAPNAHLTAYFGPLDGQVIAGSLTAPRGTGEFHGYMFKGAITCDIDTSESPSATPSAEPSVTPSVTPSAEPSVTPSVTPSAEPSVTPSVTPSADPSATPSVTPTADPSATPSPDPSITTQPGEAPSPSASPSSDPSASPSASTPGGGTGEGQLPGDVDDGEGELSGTGFDGMPIVWIAGVAMAIGGALLMLSRRTEHS